MDRSYSDEQLVAERNKHKRWLVAQPGVTGVGLGAGRNGRTVIKVYSDHISPTQRNEILGRFGDVPVEFEETGEFRAESG